MSTEHPQIPTEILSSMSDEFKKGAEKILDRLASDPSMVHVANRDMATLVTAPSIFQLCVDTAKIGQEFDIEPIFVKFLTEVGRNFIDKDGEEYKASISAVGPIALKYIPEVLSVFGISTDFREVIKKVDEKVLAGMLAREFGMEDDKYTNTLTKEEEICLKVTIAMAQAGYIHSQLFRAVKEDPQRGGKPRRFDRPVFTINAVMKQRIFDQENGDKTAKFNKVVEEVFKDVEQFK